MQVPIGTVAAEYIGFMVAFAANIFLIYLIITQTHHNIGLYKNLMLWFAVFSLWYSFIDIITQPAIHSYKNCFLVICTSWFKYDKLLGSFIVPSYCASYALTVILLAIHFIYRYIAISRPFDIRYFNYPLAIIWPSLFFGVGIFWWINCYFLLYPNSRTDAYVKETILNNYHDDIEKLSYIGPVYYFIDKNGKYEIQWQNCFGMINVLAVSVTTFIVIITLGVLIYKKMHSVENIIAEKTKRLQRQLFYSLSVQTIVPIIFMYTPTTVLFVAPIFGIDLGSMANITSICLALYPALDPLVVMFFINDYRKYILRKLSLSMNPSSDVVVHVAGSMNIII
ncbi:unnamed protein product [Caenorhabditis angaria]|uniref:Serpentine receptor class r-10 n=1 Tax=Caenorhabditis angaria TaxID=860376 RepID=A0A9P1IUA5_9PELO|nr:unnamed protein product [Caenorhabditis angaria]